MATINIETYKIGYTDQFFFDTNVWLLLFGNLANFKPKDQKEYSKLFKETLQREIPIYISSMILSEFANVLLRIDFKQWKSKNKFSEVKDFKKDFGATEEYKKSVQNVKELLKSILELPNIHLISDYFNGINKENILKDFDTVDFNDAYLAELIRNNNYKVVTNDKDFQKLESKIDIITNQI
ncbi:type II toxin-antitoxin system VapC family toxin [Flavobacterium pectinovorum]|uniref:type II toxin-antitoxin system VapC family toxin n=1 Tax=Flavobacterium pectinovorum TaxID=29533 RepID=UPI001FAD4F70|nr:PIN domain-containing protein [Flavobacterium pectinovorum]MCI9843794.1 PIN domain-containing protein [Flavobacterium pectinovorum]